MADVDHSGTSITGGHTNADGSNAGFMTAANFTKLGLYPTVSGLTTGQCIRATGAATMAFGALDLANSSAVTGVLPKANQGAQDMGGDCSGSTAACTVAKVNGTTYPAGGSLTTGTIPRVTGAATVAYGALDLANSSAVTGVLPAANRAAPTAAETVTALASAASSIAVNSQKFTGLAAGTTAGDSVRYEQFTGSAHMLYGWGDAAAPGANADRFCTWGSSGATISATENISQFCAPFAFTTTGILNWQNAAMATNTITYTMRIAGVDTANTCVLNVGSTTVLATGFSVAVAQGDILTMKSRENGTETAVTAKPRVAIIYKTSAAA